MANNVHGNASAAANATFWDALCGSKQARALGVSDGSPASLRRFDDWYFAFYPYLSRHIPFDRVAGKAVLEVGLGYGSVAQRLAEAGADYQGLDIAEGPVAMVDQRLRQSGLAGAARQGDILDAPFAAESFDFVVAIGCFHHTGDLARALAETHRLLKPGGEAAIMVYNAYGYRRWLRWPWRTARYALWDYPGLGAAPSASMRERAAYDTDAEGAAAPETVFVSRRRLARLCAPFRTVETRLENAGGERPLVWLPRGPLLATLGRVCGLDIYARLLK